MFSTLGIVAMTALLSLSLVRLPILAHGSDVVAVLALGPFALASVLAVYRPRFDDAVVALLVGYVLVILLELLRTDRVMTALMVVMVGWFAFSIAASATTDREWWWIVTAVALAPAVYVLVNISLEGRVTTGYEDRSIAIGEQATMLQALGISTSRTSFPLGVSINNFGVIAGAGLASCVVLLTRCRQVPRVWAVAGALSCLYVLLLGDSRGALATAIFVAVLLTLLPRVRAAAGVAVLLPLSPILASGAFAFLAGDGSLNREGGDIASGTGRTDIWAAVWQVLRHPSLDHVLGYGAEGQIASGASAKYAHVFGGTPESLQYPVHNAYLQQILDGGYVGLLVMVGFLGVVAWKLGGQARSHPGTPVLGALAGLLVIMLGGVTEVTPSYFAPETIVYVLLAAGIAGIRVPVAVEMTHPSGRARRTLSGSFRESAKLGGPRRGLLPPAVGASNESRRG